MAKVDTSNAERIEFPENATDADVATFQNDNQMDVDLETYMQGTQHQGGGRHDLNPRGLSSQNFEQEYTDAMDGWHNNATSSEELYAPPPAQQGQNFQRLYGQSENEKGELRRALQEQMDANRQLLAELQQRGQVAQPTQVPIAPPAFWQVPQSQTAQPQYNQYQQVPQSASTYELPDFIRKAPDEMVLAGEVNAVLKEQVAPYVYGVQQAAMAAFQQAQLAQRQLFESQKTQMGLTPQREQQILGAKPWLASISDPNAYLNAIRSEMGPTNGNGNTSGFVQHGQAPQAPQTQRILRRVGYVEGQGNGGNIQENRIDPMAQLQAEWQATLALPLGSKERGDKQRQLLHQLEVKRVSGYRDPNVLT